MSCDMTRDVIIACEKRRKPMTPVVIQPESRLLEHLLVSDTSIQTYSF